MSINSSVKKKTVIEIFGEGREYYLYSVLENLLMGKKLDSQMEHLSFRDFFEYCEWEESYFVDTLWDVCIFDTYDHRHKCSSKEDALDCLHGYQEIDEPDFSNYSPSYWELMNPSRNLRVEVSNLRLKSALQK